MPLPRISLPPLVLLLALAGPASAQDDSGADAGVFPQGFEQAIYKGLVGNALDAVPMDPLKRLELQRTNAIVGNTLLGRSLALVAGLSNPALLLGGLAWGIWAASNIKAAAVDFDSGAARKSAAPDRPLHARDARANGPSEHILLSAISALDTDALARPPVVKIWLSQSSVAQPR